VLLLLML